MTQEQENLLLKDLCARLPYGVKLGFYASATKQIHICTLLGLEPQEDEPVIAKTENGSFYMLAGNVKPFLFPLSSMSEEQGKELEKIDQEFYSLICENGDIYVSMDVRGYDWLNKNHFDFRGLIPMGLAEDATGLNIY